MSRPPKRIVLVAAVADNGVIGADGGIPWRHPEDFAHFKAETLGHTLVMGRATYDSIGRPLPGRMTIVVTRDRLWHADGVLVAYSFDEALALAAGLSGDVMVAGGAQLYALALPHATHQVLTEIHASPEGDTRYPAWDRAEWTVTRRLPGDGLDWVWWERRTAGLRPGRRGAGRAVDVRGGPAPVARAGRRRGPDTRTDAGAVIVIDPSLPDPPYDQVKTQIAAQVASGALAPGNKLPTVRRLAADLGIAPNTVARAYRELEQTGVIDTRGRAGTFVSGDQVQHAAREAAATYAAQVRALGLGRAEALALVERSLQGE